MTGKEQYYNTKQYAGAEKNNLNRKNAKNVVHPVYHTTGVLPPRVMYGYPFIPGLYR